MPLEFLCVDRKGDLVIMSYEVAEADPIFASQTTILNTSIDNRMLYKDILSMAGYTVLEEWQK